MTTEGSSVVMWSRRIAKTFLCMQVPGSSPSGAFAPLVNLASSMPHHQQQEPISATWRLADPPVSEADWFCYLDRCEDEHFNTLRAWFLESDIGLEHDPQDRWMQGLYRAEVEEWLEEVLTANDRWIWKRNWTESVIWAWLRYVPGCDELPADRLCLTFSSSW